MSDPYGHYEPDFYEPEPSEADELIESIKEKLRTEVKQEILDELAKLRKTNGELRAKVKNLAELERASIIAKGEYEHKAKQAERTAKSEANQLAANELLAVIAAPKFTVANIYTKKPKCDKCDGQRRLNYKTPSGRESYEMCVCNGSDDSYGVVEQMVKTISKDRYKKLMVWYIVSAKFMATDKEEDDYIGAEILRHPKESIVAMEDAYSLYGFDTRESAQALADYMNTKKGKS